MTVHSYEELLLLQAPPIPFIISDGVLVRATSLIIYGNPKTFKSLLVQQLCFDMASSDGLTTKWLGFKVQSQRVLYVQSEIPRIPFNVRVLKMGKNYIIPKDTLYFCTTYSTKLDRADGRKYVLDLVAKIKPDTIVFDPFFKLVSTSTEDSIAAVLDFLDELKHKHNLSVIIVTHSRKPKTTITGEIIDSGGAEIRGPLLEQWADSLIRVMGDINTDKRILHFELRNAINILQPVNIILDRAKLLFKLDPVTGP
jgi:RecA-family ATPase